MPVTKENAGEVVRYHAPTSEQVASHEKLAVAAEAFIRAVLDACPDSGYRECGDTSGYRECGDIHAAIRLIREAKMTASAAVALNGMV
jgi:hypothetical protein